MPIGLWAKNNFEDGTIIGSSQTGALGYFTDNLTVINLDGVVNKSCYEALAKKQNMRFIRQMEIEYILGWEINIEFIKKESSDFNENDITLVKTIEDYDSLGCDWYLYKVNYPKTEDNKPTSK